MDPYAGKFYQVYRAFLVGCIRHRWLSSGILLGMLAGAIWGFRHVSQNFFPDSTRPQFMVHVWMPQGSSVEATDARVRQIGEFVRKLEGVKAVTEMTATGGLRFLLTYSPENPDSSYGILLVDIEDYHMVEDLSPQILEFAQNETPDALVYTQRFVLGPGDPQKIQMRIVGPDATELRRHADRAVEILRADPRLVEIQTDWRNRVDLIRPVVSEARARNLGATRQEVAAALKSATVGTPIGVYKDGDESLPIVMRAPETERADLDALASAWFWSSALGKPVPLAQLVERYETTSEEARLRRRDRSLCITVKCNTTGETAATAFKRLAPQLEAAMADLPEGYRMEWGGEHESSANANAGLASKIPPVVLVMMLIVVSLFNSLRQPLVIFMTVPLVLIGITVGLLSFGQPFGFMALLGMLSLMGMQIKNAIVLIDEINAQTAAGVGAFDAVVNAGVTRLRPVALAALTTVLGMMPLVTDAFYAAMAVTIMCGLSFATLLTMVVIPVNYALIYRIPNPE